MCNCDDLLGIMAEYAESIGKGWRFELYYWDYSLGILLFALLMAFTFGSIGNQGRSFIPDLEQADFRNLLSAAIGGFIWNVGTLLLVASISIAGMSVAFPIGGGIAGHLVFLSTTWESLKEILFTCLVEHLLLFLQFCSACSLTGGLPHIRRNLHSKELPWHSLQDYV